MPEVPPPCRPLAAQIGELETEKASLQEDLQNAQSPSEKWGILRQITALVRQMQALGAQLNRCIEENGGPVPLTATFNATATFRTSFSSAPGPFTNTLLLPVWFDALRSTVRILSFPPIVTTPFSTPFGSNITTIDMVPGSGVGAFAPGSGNMSVSLSLLFDHSIDIPIYVEDSTVNFALTTGLAVSPIGDVSGSPLDAAGPNQITLAGASVFKDGILAGNFCTVLIAGTISPHP